MLKLQTDKWNKRSVAIAAGLGVLILGASGFGLRVLIAGIQGRLPQQDVAAVAREETLAESSLAPLISLPPAQRRAQLEAIASGITQDTVQDAEKNDKNPQPPSATTRSRARYLLATDLLAEQQPAAALERLKDLDKDYPLLAPVVGLQTARAHEALGDVAQANAAWQRLLAEHGEHPVAAEALYTLGKSDRTHWQQAMTQFPAHPRTVDIALQTLQATPETPDLNLQRIIIRHGLHLPDYVARLDGIVETAKEQLTPEDWEAIAFGYWEKLQYRKAGEAYGRAPATPKHLYRAARGLWLGGRETEAIAAYKRLVTTFPDGGDDTALGLLRLARLVNRQEAIAYLDTLMQKFPDKAPDALVEKAKALEALGSAASAKQARQSVLTQHSNSDAAAELRWQAAQTFAAAGNLKEAWAQASKLTEDNPQSDRAPQATYWIGKWAQALQKDAEAAQAYKHLLKHYPGSYYAWRAAVKLGWEVGDFQTVRQLNPAVVRSLHLDPPPAGSDLLQELYQLGQFQDAWTLWQMEFTNPKEPTVAEQFTDGLVRLGIGDNLDGMFMVSSLDFRDRPEEVAEVEALKQQPAYWEALYPFPYLELILRWSQERQLNPVLVTALIRQESRFMPAIESVAGAMGLMQVMPDTGSWVAGKIGLDAYALDNPDNNIQLGTWYLDYTHQEYSNNSLLAVASYNAGPGNVADWLARFGFDDPDVFVERIPFDETRDYVEKVFGNYWNYLRLYNPQIQEQLATLTATSEGTSDRISDKKSNPTSEATEEPSP